MSEITVFGFDVPTHALTLDGFRSWVESLGEHGPRVHFSRGRIHIEISPQNYHSHERVIEAVGNVLSRLAREGNLGRYCRPPSWITEESVGLSTEPDGFFVAYESFRSGRVSIHPTREIEMIGHPDMALEVVSKTSARKDLQELVADYAQAGVSEYWIVDARENDIVFRILVLGQDGAYVDQPADQQGWVRSPLWQSRFRLTRFNDPVGNVDYELEVDE